VNWQQAVLLGACGGAVVELVTFWQNLEAWRAARGRARAKAGKSLPRFTKYVDPAADLAAFLTRLVLGAITAGILHGQLAGSVAAVMVGASAPALLLQFGRAKAISRAVAFDPAAIATPAPDPSGSGEVAAEGQP
jgi:hypothetical protein